MPSPKRETSKSKEKDSSNEKAPPPSGASSSASPLTADIAEKLLRADLANIVKKVKSGKTLTAQERRILTAASEGDDNGAAPAFAKNYKELADLLGVDRRTLQEWRKRDGAPESATNGSHDVLEWQEFQRKIGGKGALQPADPEEGESDLPSEPILKRKKLLLFCREKEMQLAQKRGELIDISIVREAWAKKCAAANALLRKRLENELPSELEGMEAAGIYEELVKVVDEFNEVMSSGDGEIKIDPEAELRRALTEASKHLSASQIYTLARKV